MIAQLLRKWFGLEEPHCETCEVLRVQLERSERERHQLLEKLLTPAPKEEITVPSEELKPITPQVIPWRVRQQMYEAEDRRKAELMRQKAKEIAELEKELGVTSEKEHAVHGSNAQVEAREAT